MRVRPGTIVLFLLCALGGVCGFLIAEGTISVGTEYTNQGVGYATMFVSGFLFVFVRRMRRGA